MTKQQQDNSDGGCVDVYIPDSSTTNKILPFVKQLLKVTSIISKNYCDGNCRQQCIILYEIYTSLVLTAHVKKVDDN